MAKEAKRPGAEPCPTCGKPATEASRPFCSGRCADVDLNRWLSGVYAVPVEEDEDGGDPLPSSHVPREEGEKPV